MAGELVPIKCYARIRPATSDKAKSTLKISTDRVTLDAESGGHTYAFDKVYGFDITIGNIYKDTCESVIQRVVEGSNAAIIAVGPTGAGKSYFLQGTDSELGLAPSIFKGLFESINKSRKDKLLLVTVSFLEIMDDQMADLLNPHGKEMSMVRHPQIGEMVDGLSELVVRTADDVAQLFEQGCRARRMSTSDVRAHRERAHALFTVAIEQRESATAKLRLRSKLVIADLAGIESAACSAVVEVVEALGSTKKKSVPVAAPYGSSPVTLALQDPLGGNCITNIFAVIVPNEQNAGKALSFIQDARNIKNSVQINVNDADRVISDLRESVCNLRDQIAKQSGTKEDVRRLQDLVKELQIAKQQTWEEKVKLSAKYEQERKANLANKGLLEWVMDTRKKGNAEVQQRISELQKEKDQASKDYKEKQQAVDALKEDLKKKLEDYAKLSESGKAAEADGRALLTAIHSLKERLQQQNESLKNSKLQIADLAGRLGKERERATGGGGSSSGSGGNTMLAGSIDMRRAVETAERERWEAEHRALIGEELERSKFELEQEKADIQLRVAEGKKYSSEDCIELETTIAQMKADKSVMALQLQVLQQEKERLVSTLEGAYKQHKADLDTQQLRTFQAFRDYRDVFEKQKAVLEQRYRRLLEDAIQDAVYLSSRNSEMQQESLALKQQLAALKDKVSRTGA